MSHKRLFTWSFVASGVAVSFLAVFGVTCATIQKKKSVFNNLLFMPHIQDACRSNVKCLRIIILRGAGNEAVMLNIQNQHIHSWCNGDRKWITQIKQKPFMDADIGLYGKLTEAHWGPWQSTYSTCAVIVTAIVLRRWRRPALALSSQISTSNLHRPPLWAHTMGWTIGHHIPACSKTWLAWG